MKQSENSTSDLIRLPRQHGSRTIECIARSGSRFSILSQSRLEPGPQASIARRDLILSSHTLLQVENLNIQNNYEYRFVYRI